MTKQHRNRRLAVHASLATLAALAPFSNMAQPGEAQESIDQAIMNGNASPSGGSIPPASPPKELSTPKPVKAPAAPTVPDAVMAPTPAAPSTQTSTPSSTPVSAPTTATAPHAGSAGEESRKKEEAKKAEEKREPEARKLESEHLKKEAPQAATVTVHQTPSAPAEPASAGGGGKPTMLFGRIEQLTATSGASFPQLKAMTPKMDTSKQEPLKAAIARSPQTFSGKIVSSFPPGFHGNWGGNILLQVANFDPNYQRLDPAEYARTVQIMKPGMQGAINFNFQGSAGKVALAPTSCMFLVPASETSTGDQMKQMMGQQAGPMAGMMSQMMAGMKVPVVLEFGTFQTDAMVHGLSGNTGRQNVVKNDVRQLAQNVLEQDIVTSSVSRDKSGRVRNSYGESVLRFTYQGGGRMYVQIAAVEYSADKRFLSKEMLAGYVQQGAVAATKESYVQSQGGQLGGLGGLGGLNGMTGGQLPAGFPSGAGAGSGASDINNMMKQLFGGQ